MEEVGIVMVMWCILRSVGIIFGHLMYLLVNRYIFPVLVSITERNLAALFLKSYLINICRVGKNSSVTR
jgi:hypothetical protein